MSVVHSSTYLDVKTLEQPTQLVKGPSIMSQKRPGLPNHTNPHPNKRLFNSHSQLELCSRTRPSRAARRSCLSRVRVRQQLPMADRNLVALLRSCRPRPLRLDRLDTTVQSQPSRRRWCKLVRHRHLFNCPVSTPSRIIAGCSAKIEEFRGT